MAADLPAGEPVVADAAAERPQRKARTRKPRPTYEDGALTRVFKFPSKAYPRSTYYVTGDEIIIRIKKARKKWKLVIPKKRVVSYRTNRWFAKPRWVELELTVTQATRLGLVEPRAKGPAGEAAHETQALDQPAADEASADADEVNAGIDATDGTAGEDGPEVALIDESDGGGDAEGSDADDMEDDEADGGDGEVDDATGDHVGQDVRPEAAGTAERESGSATEEGALGTRQSVAPEAVRTQDWDDVPAPLDTVAGALVAGENDSRDPESAGGGAGAVAPAAAPVCEPDIAPPRDRVVLPEATRGAAPVVIHLSGAPAIETAGDSDGTDQVTPIGQAVIDATATLTATDMSEPSPAGLTSTGHGAGPLHGYPPPAVTDDTRTAERTRSAGRFKALTLMAALLIAGSATMWVVRDGEPVPEQVAAAGSAVEEVATPASPIETGSISRSVTPAPPESREPPPVAEAIAPDITEASIEPMERLPDPTMTALLAVPTGERARQEQPAAQTPSPSSEPAVSPVVPAASAAPAAAEVSAGAAGEAEPRLKSPVRGVCLEMEAAARSIRVQFDYASAIPDDPALGLLDAFVAQLSACPGGRVIIEGHADADGDADRNQALSVRRAQAVWEHLVKAGVSPQRLSVIGFGHSRPDVPNVSPENKHRNRRVVLVAETPR